jgi:hypothetical protein
VALLGTLRRNGTPRISPIEPGLTEGELLFEAIAWSGKAHDLARDARCVLHSAVTALDAGADELKLYGRAEPLGDGRLRRASDAWWVSRPLDQAAVFSLDIRSAVLVSWDLEAGRMTLRRWSPERGASELTRRYP